MDSSPANTARLKPAMEKKMFEFLNSILKSKSSAKIVLRALFLSPESEILKKQNPNEYLQTRHCINLGKFTLGSGQRATFQFQ